MGNRISVQADGLSLNDLVPGYLPTLASFLQAQMPDAWQWFHSDRFTRDDIESVRLDLLRSTVRIDREKNDRVYGIVDAVATKLELGIPVTLYQVQNPSGWNAAAMPVTDHAHLLIEGPLLKEFSDEELTAVLSHELAHVLLWRIDDRRHRTTLRLLDALCSDTGVAEAHLESSRLCRLHTEVFCDRIACHVIGSPLPAIASLIKVGTQSSEVDPQAYLRQANEIFAAGKVKSDQVTHPELFIRARALQLWFDKKNNLDQAITQMIVGDVELERLDLIQRDKHCELTLRTIDAILRHEWLRTDAALAHARLFNDKYQWKRLPTQDLESLSLEISKQHESIQKFIAYVLLDFATTERELEDLPLAASMDLAERFEISVLFREIARKELKMRVKQWNDLDQNKANLLARAVQ